MIYTLNGILLEKDLGLAVVDCNGVGFAVNITGNCLSRLPDVGDKVLLFTHLNVREDAMELFGFFDTDERDCFKLLTGVSGVGSKMALSILSELTPERLALSIVSADQASITRANGVGPKLAQRVILELKDKIQKEMPALLQGKSVQPVQAGVGEKSAEVISALMTLGYTQHEAKRAVGAVEITELTVEQAIKAALVQLMG